MKLITTIKLIIAWLNSVLDKSVICGVFVDINWFDEPKSKLSGYYISFSPCPDNGDLFDDYGYADDEIFCYKTGIGEIIKLVWRRHAEGWQVCSGTLNTATDIEATDTKSTDQ